MFKKMVFPFTITGGRKEKKRGWKVAAFPTLLMLCLLVLFNGLELDLPVPLCYFTHIIHAPTRTTSIRKYKDLNVYKDDVFLLPRSVLGVEVFT